VQWVEYYYLKAVKAVFPQFGFVPTGGINLENAVDYIKAGAFAVGMGGKLTKEKNSVITKHARTPLDKIKLNSNQKIK